MFLQYDGGRWPSWADGQGASLELRDPRSDNDTPGAWADSDESAKSQWREFTFTIEASDTRYTHDSINVFGVMLLNRGEVLLDDLSVTMGRGNILRNGGFESAEANWRRLGNHVRSFATTEDSRSGSRLNSSGSTLIATSRSRIVSTARQTIPIPPAPICSIRR